MKNVLLTGAMILSSAPTLADSSAVEPQSSQKFRQRTSCLYGATSFTTNRQVKVLLDLQGIPKPRIYSTKCDISALQKEGFKDYLLYSLPADEGFGELVGASETAVSNDIKIRIACTSNDPLHTKVSDTFTYPEEPLPAQRQVEKIVTVPAANLDMRMDFVSDIYGTDTFTLAGTFREDGRLTWEVDVYPEGLLPENLNEVDYEVNVPVTISLSPESGMVVDGHSGLFLDTVAPKACQL